MGPAWAGGDHGEEAALRSCYTESLCLAKELRCESVAFPLISEGNYGFPKDLAVRTASSAIYDFLMENDMTVYLVVFDRTAYDLSGKLFSDVKAYIDENYVADRREEEYGELSPRARLTEEERQAMRTRHLEEMDRNFAFLQDTAVKCCMAAPDEAEGAELPEKAAIPDKMLKMDAIEARPESLEEALAQTDITFQECLLKLIIERDLKNSAVYNGANITRQTFSKIMSNKNYHPTKNTACALAISLKLDLEETNALLEKAGLVLSSSSRFDLAVRYFITHRQYNIIQDNIALDGVGLEVLGSKTQ